MKRTMCTLLGLVIVTIIMPAAGSAASAEKMRVIVETDMGGDPDDQASLVRFLMYKG